MNRDLTAHPIRSEFLQHNQVVKYDHHLLGIDLDRARQAVAKTVEYARSKMGEQAWNEGMNPAKADVELIENPYTYTDREHAKAAQQKSAEA